MAYPSRCDTRRAPPFSGRDRRARVSSRSAAASVASILSSTGLLLAVTLGSASIAWAGPDDHPSNRDRSWAPFLGLELGIHAQELKASGSTSFGASGTGTNTVSTLLARLEGVLVSPRLADGPLTPRLTIRGGISFPTRESATIESSEAVLDDTEVGSSLDVSWRQMWHAAVGLSMQVPWWQEEFPITIEPRFEYLGGRVRFEPSFTFRAQPGSERAEMTSNPLNPPRVEFPGRSSLVVHHYAGVGLGLSTAPARVGWIEFRGHLRGNLYWLVSGRDTSATLSGLVDGSSETGAARMELDATAGQVAFGMSMTF